MVLAERAESERLRQIIKELQRHRFGRRAESLPEDQLLLGLEEAEQVEAACLAEVEETTPTERSRAARRRTNRGALPAHLPRIERVVDVESTIARAVRARCTALARTSRSVSTSCRPSSGSSWCVDPNTPAGPARRWWCRRPRPHASSRAGCRRMGPSRRF